MIELQKKELVFDIKNTAAAYADSISSSCLLYTSDAADD